MLLVGSRGQSAILALFFCSSTTALATPIDDIKSLVEANRSNDAYELGRQNPDLLGDQTFDFYFGIASIDAGHAGEGVFALERYLLAFPDNVSARLQLARGYFTLGEDARARDEFEAVQKLNPPADVAATIQRFLDSIRLRESRYSLSTGMYVEMGIGTDSNVNGGVPNANITLPGLGPVVIAQNGLRTSDKFTSLGVGGYLNAPIAPGVALFANGTGEMKSNWSGSNRGSDLGNYNASGGASWLLDKNLFRLSATDNQIVLGSTNYRSTTGIAAEWQYQIDERQSFNLGTQSARQSYTGNFMPYNANLTGYNAGYRRIFSYPWQPMLSLTANTGHESTMTQRPDLVRNIDGTGATVSFTPAANWGVALGYSFQRSKYQGPDAFLGVTRQDKYDAYNATVSYLISRSLSFRFELLTSKNRSNIPLYEFPREIVTYKLRYEFK